MKQQTVAAFIDIYGAYNMLIDILCNILMDRELPSRIVMLLDRLLWRKLLVFFAGGREYMTLIGYNGLPQGSVLSSFVYNVIGSCADRFVPAGCGFLQYADDFVVYVAHRLIGI
jgi:Reverse transcriptase (RNA-dependent DNA polymerase)